MFHLQNFYSVPSSLGRGDISTHSLSSKAYAWHNTYLDDNDEHGLEEQVDCVPVSHPEVYSEDAGDHKDSADVDGEGADGFLIADEFELAVVADDRCHGYCDVDQPHLSM